jgi:hypothetical protein
MNSGDERESFCASIARPIWNLRQFLLETEAQLKGRKLLDFYLFPLESCAIEKYESVFYRNRRFHPTDHRPVSLGNRQLGSQSLIARALSRDHRICRGKATLFGLFLLFLRESRII